MPELKLTYFDIHGGRGEAPRLAMAIGGVPFEDRRLSYQEFVEQRDSFPFRAVPTLEIDGSVISQSNGICRYVGKLAKLYPDDALQAAYCDEAMDAVEEITSRVAQTMSIKDPEERRRVRTELAEGPISFYLERLERLLERRGGEYFADGRLTVADLKVAAQVRPLTKGVLDHVPADLPQRVAPKLVAHMERVLAHPKIVAYYG